MNLAQIQRHIAHEMLRRVAPRASMASMKRTPTGSKPPRRALWTARNLCFGAVTVFCLDVWPVLRQLPFFFWVDIGFLLSWYIADPMLTHQPWHYLTLPLPPAITMTLLMKWDPPAPRTTSLARAVIAYLLPRYTVPLLAESFAFENALNWNVRLIAAAVAVFWLSGVLYVAHRKRKTQVLLRRLEHEQVQWKAVLGIPLTDDENNQPRTVYTPLDGYSWWLSKNYADYYREWEATNGHPRD